MSCVKYLVKNRVAKVIFIILMCSFACLLYTSTSYRTVSYKHINDYRRNLNNIVSHNEEVERFKKKRQAWTTSNLGSILFKFEDPSRYGSRSNRTFVVLIWKYWGWLKKRHVYNYGTSKGNVLRDCSVKNCIFSGDDSLIMFADAVLIHLQNGNIPHVEDRDPRQRWIYLNDESPWNAFSLAKQPISWKNLTNVFNWSMTYRTEADVPVPYGRTVPLSKPVKPKLSSIIEITELIPNWRIKQYDVLATVLISNCAVKHRMDFLAQLRKYIKVDVYGKCGDDETTKNRCPGHFRADCEPISEYLFYLVLENSMCSEYLSEKIFYQAYMKGSIPIILGPPAKDCESLLPPNSYLYVDSNTSIEDLANHMLSISQDPNLLLSFHTWRNHFKVVNEHGYFGTQSYHMCRLCEALNYNDEANVYDETGLKRFLDPSVSCIKVK